MSATNITIASSSEAGVMKAGSLILPSSTVLRARHLTTAIYALGPTPTFELLCDLIAASSATLDVLETYARIDPEILDQYNGRELPPLLHRVK